MEYKITKDRILAAAAKCGTAKATLETLFPEAFENEYIQASPGFTIKKKSVLVACGVTTRPDADMCITRGYKLEALDEHYYRFVKI